MAAISSQREIGMYSDRSAGTPITGDKSISESTLKELATFILDNNYEREFDEQGLRSLKVAPLTCDEVKFGIRLINDHPLITVVENELNQSETGGTRITMIREIYVKDLQQVGAASDRGIVLANLEAGRKIKTITVSQKAFEALNRYKTQLERTSRRYQSTGYQSLSDSEEVRWNCSCWERGCAPDLAKFIASSACCLYSFIELIRVIDYRNKEN